MIDESWLKNHIVEKMDSNILTITIITIENRYQIVNEILFDTQTFAVMLFC